LLAWQTL
jgi:hypothetical protein